MQNIIAIENGVVRHPLYRMKKPINMTLAEGEHIAIVGPNGAGKSILVDTIIGRWPLLMNEVKYDFYFSRTESKTTMLSPDPRLRPNKVISQA